MNYLFLIKARGYEHGLQIVDVSNVEFQAKIICSSSFEKLLEICIEQVASGAQVVELCGGFTNDEAICVQKRLSAKAAVGHVQFTEMGAIKLAQLGFGS